MSEYSEEQIENIKKSLKPAVTKPLDLELAKSKRLSGGDAQLRSGIIIPSNIVRKTEKSRWHYFAKPGPDRLIVFRRDLKDYTEEVRTYSKAKHGENYEQLANQFIKKNNDKYAWKEKE